MADDIIDAFMKRYGKVYNSEANDRALFERELVTRHKLARQAEIDRLFPPKA